MLLGALRSAEVDRLLSDAQFIGLVATTFGLEVAEVVVTFFHLLH